MKIFLLGETLVYNIFLVIIHLVRAQNFSKNYQEVRNLGFSENEWLLIKIPSMLQTP